jgi:tRNA(Ile)-lysidine synthase
VLTVPAALSAGFHQFDLNGHKAVLAAVSGGSDSMAMLHLLHDHIRIAAPGMRLVVATIDHALRPDSGAETSRVAGWAGRMGLGHVSRRWDLPKPDTGIPEAARDARYALLAELAAQAGATVVFTGHTADDQAETVAMRRRRGPGIGSAGMASATLYRRSLWIARPLLATPRTALRTWLAGEGIDWIEDPSNADPAYERVRMRDDLRHAGAAAIAALTASANEAATARRRLAYEAAGFVAAAAQSDGRGLLFVDWADDAGGEAARAHALRYLLASAGGLPYAPPVAAVEGLLARLARPGAQATLARVLVRRSRTTLTLVREGRGLPDPLPARDGMVWDGRFRLAGPSGAGIVRCGAADDAAGPLARLAAASRPDVVAPDGRHARGWTATPLLPTWDSYLPAFDLPLAAAVARLVGAPPPPAAPFARHNDVAA